MKTFTCGARPPRGSLSSRTSCASQERNATPTSGGRSPTGWSPSRRRRTIPTPTPPSRSAGVDDQKQFATVAKSSPHGNVRAAALGRVHDLKTLGSVARNAADGQTALEAVAKIADPAELLNVAMRTDHKEAGLAALEKCAAATPPGEQRGLLEGISGRAKNKSVTKRARAMVQAMDEAEAARRLALQEWQQRVAAVAARVEAIAATPSVPDAAAQVDAAEAAWGELASAGTFELDADSAGRFGSLVESARAGIAAHERALAEQRAAADRVAADRAVRRSVCERIENARADEALSTLEAGRAEWEGLPPSETADAEDQALRDRFVAACARAGERLQNRQDMERTNARLGELSLEAERLVSLETLPEGDWAAVVREWHALRGKSEDLDPAVAERYGAAEALVAQRVEERRAASERARRQHVQRIEQLLERVTKRAGAEDVTLREADRIARELRTAVEAPNEDRELVDRLKAAQTVIAPKLHELREMDEWKRFANAAVQEELIAKTEALRAKYNFDAPEGPKPDDLEKAARDLHEIQERWKQAAEAPRAQAQALWHRYRQAADPIQAKVREFFAVRSEERKGNLDRKLALIERAEALAESTDWIRTAEELKKLQAEWQAIGPVPRQDTRVTWKRFRDACDKFFTRRNADLAERKETWSANLARKEALCVRAEELAASTEWEKGAAEIRRMQADWKTVGPVRRNKSEVVWQRFRTACDTFFDRYKRRDQIELEAKYADREALVTGTRGPEPGRPRRGRRHPRTGNGRRHRTGPAGRGRPRHAARAGPLLAQPLEPVIVGGAARSRPPQCALHAGPRTAHGGLPRGLPGHRTRRRREPAEDGKAGRKSRGLPRGRGRTAGQFLAGACRDAA